MTGPIYVVGDVHLGLKKCKIELFDKFLDDLPDNAALLLNGDTVTRWAEDMPDSHLKVLKRLQDESAHRRVIWLKGNHDHAFNPKGTEKLEFKAHHIEDDSILICHGDKFDVARKYCFPLVFLVYTLHRIRMLLGFSAISTAFFARKMAYAYVPYKKLFIRHAIKRTRKLGCHTVICGHVHCPEELEDNGVRYINLGSWTADPIRYAIIQDGNVEVKTYK